MSFVGVYAAMSCRRPLLRSKRGIAGNELGAWASLYVSCSLSTSDCANSQFWRSSSVARKVSNVSRSVQQ
jgi:hypothetical protein